MERLSASSYTGNGPVFDPLCIIARDVYRSTFSTTSDRFCYIRWFHCRYI